MPAEEVNGRPMRIAQRNMDIGKTIVPKKMEK